MTGLASQRVREVPVKTDPAIPGAPRARARIDVIRLKRALRKAVDGEVRFDPGSLAMYANDASNFRQVPIGVVIPRTLDDVVAAHRVCHQFGAPILNRGGGTSLSGETVNYAVVINHSKYLTGIGEIDPEQRLVTCQTGVINEELNRHTGQHNLVFGPDPSSHSRCVIGGNIGNNSCGVHSVQAQLYGPGPAHLGQRARAGGGHLRRRAVLGGQRRGSNARGDHRGRWPPGRDLRRAARPAGQVRRRDPRPVSLGGEGAAPGVRLQPRRAAAGEGLQRGPGADGDREHLRDRAPCGTDADACHARSGRWWWSASPPSPRPPSTATEIIERWRPIGLEGLDEELIQDQSAQRIACRESRRAAQGRVTGLAARTVRRRHRRGVGGHRAGLRDVADRREGIRRGPDPGDEKRAGGRAEPGHLGDPRGRPRLHRVRARRGQLAGLGGLGGAALGDRAATWWTCAS